MLAYNFKIYNCVLEHFSDSLFERTLFEGNLIKRYIAGFGLFSHAFAGFDFSVMPGANCQCPYCA